jgi:8-oxo-dGTP pyrophosphatase MutT (NUDIX family)
MQPAKTFVVCKTLVINQDGQLLVMKRADMMPRRPNEWDIPGGGQENGEGLTAAAIRETVEESGIVLREPLLVYAHTEMRDYGSGSWLFFLAHVKNPDVQISPEHTEYRWVSLAEAVSLIDYSLHKQVLGYIMSHNLHLASTR